MCGRFAITLPPEAMAQLFGALPGNDLPHGGNFNVCPTQTIATCTAEGGARRLRAMRWGFLPHWYQTPGGGPLLINARAETIAEKPAFRVGCRERRCLVPMDGFYEWTRADPKKPLPWFIRRADGAPLVLGGIWQDWERDGQSLTSCAIVTGPAGKAMSAIHDREPLVLERDHWPLWLGETGKGAASLMHASAEDVLAAHRVGTEVNSNRAAGEGLVAPLAG